jgi:lipopolysaccharide/colanic/teichoic acid biosynthesis glycosyltransferase
MTDLPSIKIIMSLYNIAKRLMDILAGVVGVVLFLPFMILTALWIKIVSPNGSLFVERRYRVGQYGKEFWMFKFRTMIPHAQQWLETQPELYKQYQDNGYKLDPDPRWIKGAKFLRKTSLDELPQFFNVLIGNMSLVGYRAYYGYEVREQIARNPDAKEYLDAALTVKPGITGLWQVSGRSQVSFMDRVKLDAKYAKTKSIMYDLIIVLKTPLAVISGKGAF